MARRNRMTAALAALGLAGAALVGCAPDAPAAVIEGTIAPLADADRSWSVTAWVSGDGETDATELGTAEAGDDGGFRIPLSSADLAEGAVAYVVARAGEATLAALVPETVAETPSASPASAGVTVNERTTVALGYATAQFAGEDGLSGPSPGLRNAAAMSTNLADPATGQLGSVLTSSPNGSETSTLPAFVSLTSALIACVADDAACGDLRAAGTVPGSEPPGDTLQAFAGIAKAPAAAVEAVFDLAQGGQLASEPGLADAPAAWTLALRFDGDGQSIDGPGNFAIDPEGNIWVNNNYQYNADRSVPVCGSDLLFKFSPTGEFIDGSPFQGGGLSGSGFGIAFDRSGQLWVSNYGFAAPGCPAEDQPPHDSVSLFGLDGEPVVDEPYTQGELNWPQGTIVADDGSVWLANCNTSTLTIYPDGDPDEARVVGDLGLDQAFGLVDNGSLVFATGTASSTVAVLERDGTPAASSPLSGGGLDRPMGIASDAAGNVWVGNSGAITLPCPDRPEVGPNATGSISMISADGTTITGPFTGGGVSTPWGVTTDGAGNVWVAEFSGQRVVQFCGADPSVCPPGSEVGDPISPDGTGYAFDGITRSTGVVVDPSGNVWVTNNWLLDAVQTNPGGHEIVAFLGIAPPVEVEPFE